MEEQWWICSGCARTIAPEDTFVVSDDHLSHLDCKRPEALTPEERALLFRYCWDQAAAECEHCAKSYRITELASDLFSGKELLCPRCRADLIGSVRTHLYGCEMLPVTVRLRAREAREAAQRLVKRSRELADRADLLMRELEVALRALREAAVREPPPGPQLARLPKRSTREPRAGLQILPTELRVGDRLDDETGEWVVIDRPFTTAAGKNVHVRVRKVARLATLDLKTWGAHERISVQRANPEEGKR